MKRLFIFSQWMEIDGVEASLLGLLKELDYSQVSVDLFLTLHQGPWMSEIPREVNLLPEHPRVVLYASSLERLKREGHWGAFLLTQVARYLAAIWYRVFLRRKVDFVGYEQVKYAVWAPFLPKRLSQKRYDGALIFGGEAGFARRVRAKFSAVWIHNDWSHYAPIVWLGRFAYRHIDKIVNVSQSAKEAFDCRYPSARQRSVVVENLLSSKWMVARSLVREIPAFSGLKILSVGRLSAQKRLSRAVAAAKLLKAQGLHFQWRVVGDGEEAKMLRNLIQQEKVEDVFFLEGATDNPMPYYPWCDFYVCTSDWEGKSVSVREAQIFAKPVVITRFPTASSQLEEGVDGLIAECTPESVAEKILTLAQDLPLRKRLSSTCRQRDYANRGEIDSILSWME